MGRYAIKTPTHHTTWDKMLEVWTAADAAEVFESAWNFDHFYPIRGDTNGPCLEAWVTLSALAQATKRIRLGTMVCGMHFRHPAVTASMASSLDIVSRGRLELGLGAGWYPLETDAYGMDLGTVDERMTRFEEGTEVIHLLLSEETTDFQRCPGPGEAGLHRAHRHAEQAGDLLDREVGQVVQDYHLAVGAGEGCQRVPEVGPLRGRRVGDQPLDGTIPEQDGVQELPAPPPPTHHVDRHCAQPGFGRLDVGESRWPGQRAGECLLNHVLRLRQVGGERVELGDQTPEGGVVELGQGLFGRCPTGPRRRLLRQPTSRPSTVDPYESRAHAKVPRPAPG